MNAASFDRIVENQANANVQAKIEKFRRKVREALFEIYPHLSNHGLEKMIDQGEALPIDPKGDHGNTDFWQRVNEARFILGSVVAKHPHIGWPASLWEDERKTVAADIISKLDIVAQALIAKPPSATDARPVGAPDPESF